MKRPSSEKQCTIYVQKMIYKKKRTNFTLKTEGGASFHDMNQEGLVHEIEPYEYSNLNKDW